MFQQPSSTNDGGGSGLYRGVSALGTVFGIGVAILAMPLVFRYTRGPLLSYLSDAWGDRAGELLMWVFCGVEAFAIFFFVKLLFSSCVIWAMTAFAARRL
jgi:hypothetical protein